MTHGTQATARADSCHPDGFLPCPRLEAMTVNAAMVRLGTVLSRIRPAIASAEPWRMAVVGATVLLALWVISPTPGRLAIGSVFLLAPTVAIPIGVRRYRSQHARPWLILALGTTVIAVAGGALGVIVATHQFWALDGGLLLLMGGMAVRLFGFVRLVQSRGGVDRGLLIDIAIVVLAGGLLAWFGLIDPIWARVQPTTSPTSVITSGLDIILFALTLCLVLSSGRRGVALWLLVGGSGLLLFGDLGKIYLTGLGAYQPGWLTDLGWGLGHVAWAVAALHPSMLEVAESGREMPRLRVHHARVIGMAGAPLVAPILLFVAITVDDHGDLACLRGPDVRARDAAARGCSRGS